MEAPQPILKHLFLKFQLLIVPGRSEALLTSDWLSPTLELGKCFPKKLQDNFMDFCASDAPLKPVTVEGRKVSKRTQDPTHQL